MRNEIIVKFIYESINKVLLGKKMLKEAHEFIVRFQVQKITCAKARQKSLFSDFSPVLYDLHNLPELSLDY